MTGSQHGDADTASPPLGTPSATAMSANAHPMRRLIGYARDRQRDVWLASLYSVLNKVFDVLPEILIGVAVDVVVHQRESFIARMGLPDPVHQLLLLLKVSFEIRKNYSQPLCIWMENTIKKTSC